VLIAEDNPINQMLVSALVRQLGHRATCVNNGLRALEAARAMSFDCILMDMQMPEMDGIAATRAIRAEGGPNAAVPIIALSADAAPERRRFYENIGLTDFITKPISIEALRRPRSDGVVGRREPQQRRRRAGGPSRALDRVERCARAPEVLLAVAAARGGTARSAW
jgi:CheY-like chemotaxis protein